MFLANMSHDLKIPLSGIISIAKNLSYRLSEPRDKKHRLHYVIRQTIIRVIKWHY
ncbi:histidine kinase dimerization/phospho-acceptor domain-containing protein [Coxiella-like endosymbiont of Rhipicephalus sanguineus]|uniref:histidine kinase dimerization/phospho-acceptor domain-containing protein n=1 Tax=Coxiella-like endosymbiont of Rhipicephalus sanguineus TaxID=1955402 RepID=UPI003556CF98